ncbi:ligase-associated DNA damage response endonuclease PdeM [Primorskyibacter aestuariivivens]|uniref:ligase-associated DNA damage response endonuclease PdeM n=1 Tax=Primorskyibacter aestuariivivens TaxID=1888912 RepID=UPI0023008B39|nr:ligase-associated DNA damage response endonuclease PdeM [Primorskyibacter aestuariivivens]MDA7428432.1 ligase-associated DNA damage response endonuclease PdeM [Primorskyibacter aestuariivivens]
MNTHSFTLAGQSLMARPSGTLYWPERKLLCVSDLHLGKSVRQARRNGAQLPPYDLQDTLARLEGEINETGALTVLCLGDSFDDLMALDELPDMARLWITRLQAGRHWIWIEGNHDPGPVSLGGTHLAELNVLGLTFRHEADPEQNAEISGHFHPKARLRTRAGMVSRPCFLLDNTRLILPAFGTYTGGLRCEDAPLCDLMGPEAIAILTGARALAVPMPRGQNRSGRAASSSGR